MIESLALHLGFPVSVDLPHPSSPSSVRSRRSRNNKDKSSKSSKCSSSNKSTQSSSTTSSYHAFTKSSATPNSTSSNSSCHALDWMDHWTQASDWFSCGGNKYYASEADSGSMYEECNSIMVPTAMKNKKISSRKTQKACRQDNQQQLRYPSLHKAHVVKSSSSHHANATTSTSNPKNFIFSMFSRDEHSTSSSSDDLDVCTTATTASMHSIMSWNTVPTADSTSFLEGVYYLNSNESNEVESNEQNYWTKFVSEQQQYRVGVTKNRRVSTPQAATTTSTTVSYLRHTPSMRRCTSDPMQAALDNAQSVQYDVFPDLMPAQPIEQ
ncbi:hypothetical protein MPSEU_001104900 [Mayamaea pseudoterrestris]|nr:hypothetical protein MPSEU_001104900 [Mayamaea pseudoterrestris]